MKKYIANKGMGQVVSLDTENMNIDMINSQYSIDYMYTIPEDGELIIDKVNTKAVKAGDILLKLYGIEDNEREYVLLNSAELKDYFARKEAFEAKEKAERVTKSNCEGCSNCKCTPTN